MVAVKNHEAARFLRSPDQGISAILTYGTDAGLASERARSAAQSWAALEDPPSEIIRLGDADLETDPDRLSVEVMMVPMFGDRKVILAAAGRRINAKLLKELITAGPLPSVLVVEAGNLKPTDALRSIFEKAKHAAAIACFPDEGRDLAALVDEEIKSANMTISPEARDLLIAQLGADRALSRGEIDKLILYCAGRKRIEPSDVEAIVSDASELNIDRIVNAAAAGQAGVAVRELARALTGGENAQMIILALQRHFMRLHRIQAEVSAGRSVADAMKSLRPPLHFKQKNAVSSQIRRWPLATLTRAQKEISLAARNARSTGARDDLVAESLLLALAKRAR